MLFRSLNHSGEWCVINNKAPTTSAAEEAEAPAAEEAEALAAEEVAPGDQLINQSVGEPMWRYSARSHIEDLLGDDRHIASRRSSPEPSSGLRWQGSSAGWQNDQTWWQQGGQQGWQWQQW